MRRYRRDCDGDDQEDCHDFARIHKLGSDRCSTEDIQDTEYWRKFALCYGCDPTPLDREDPEDEDYDEDEEYFDEEENMINTLNFNYRKEIL